MADRVTDGTSSSGNSAGSSDAWESMLAEGISSTGVDPNATLEALSDTPAETTQGASTESSAGRQPAEPQAPQTAPTGDAGSAPPAPTTGPAPAAAEPSYPAGTKPFSYDVNGQSKQIDGAFHIPGEGLYVPEDKVAHFELMMSRAETLAQINQQQSREYQTLERATTWTQDNKTLTGVPALEAQRVYTAQASVALGIVLDVLKPENIGKYTTVAQSGRVYEDGSPEFVIVPNEQAMAMLKEQLAFKTDRAAFTAQKNFATVSAPPPPPAPTFADYAAPTIEGWVTAHGLTGLTDADKKALIEDFPRYGVKEPNGQLAIHPQLLERAKERSQMRIDAKAQVKTAEEAGKFNAGMNAGKKAPPVQRPTAQPAAPAATEKRSKNAAWDDLLTSALPEVLQGMG